MLDVRGVAAGTLEQDAAKRFVRFEARGMDWVHMIIKEKDLTVNRRSSPRC